MTSAPIWRLGAGPGNAKLGGPPAQSSAFIDLLQPSCDSPARSHVQLEEPNLIETSGMA